MVSYLAASVTESSRGAKNNVNKRQHILQGISAEG